MTSAVDRTEHLTVFEKSAALPYHAYRLRKLVQCTESPYCKLAMVYEDPGTFEGKAVEEAVFELMHDSETV